MTYPEPEFPIGHVVRNRLDEPFTVVAHIRSDKIMAHGSTRLFSDEDAKRTPWFYTLRALDGREHDISDGGVRSMETARRSIQDLPSTIPASQRGRLSIGERLRSPHGTWVVVASRTVDERGVPQKHRSYLLTHDDGHQEEWLAPDMADADFHRIRPDQQTLI